MQSFYQPCKEQQLIHNLDIATDNGLGKVCLQIGGLTEAHIPKLLCRVACQGSDADLQWDLNGDTEHGVEGQVTCSTLRYGSW